MTSDRSIDLNSNPMDWMNDDAGSSDRGADNLNVVGLAARIAVFNHVRCAFEVEQGRGTMSRKRLADTLRVSQALVGRWLREPSNMTVETAAKLLFAMGREFRLASPQTERADGIATVRDIKWIKHPVANAGPVLNVAILNGQTEIRSAAGQGDVRISVFEGDDCHEAWISGPGIHGSYFKSVSVGEKSPRIEPLRAAHIRRDGFVDA